MKGFSRTMVLTAILLILGAALAVAIGYGRWQKRRQADLENQFQKENSMGTLRLQSSAFEHNGSIPRVYTCQGDNTNPPLSISGVAPEAKSLVLMMDDPDAPVGVWDHWVLWNIPPDTTEIVAHSVPTGAVVGSNSAGTSAYQGPCPPLGMHRYRFTLYALSDLLSLAPGSNKQTVLIALQGKVIDQFTLIGLYQKS